MGEPTPVNVAAVAQVGLVQLLSFQPSEVSNWTNNTRVKSTFYFKDLSK